MPLPSQQHGSFSTLLQSLPIETIFLRKMSKTKIIPAPQILLCIFTFVHFTFHVNSQPSSNKEKTILLQLKQQFSTTSPFFLNHWTSSSDHCTWPEISCTHDNSVSAIRLVNLNISKPIPPFICDLKNLTFLDVNYNIIPGPFPTLLYNCSNLEYLDLSFNFMNSSLPNDINRLSPKLQYFNITANFFTGDIPPAIGGLKQLKELQFASNAFHGSFPAEIGDLTNLESLNLNLNKFAPQEIPSSFTKLKKLKNIWMSEINLIGEIPESIGNMLALEFLDLSINGLSGSIPSSLFQTKNLTIVYLYTNRLTGEIPQIIESFNLEVIDLSDNSLTGKIPENFGELTKMTGLSLFMNQLSGNLPIGIGKLPVLADVKLFGNSLSGEIPPDFGRFSMLRDFQVFQNHFTGKLPEALCYNKGLLMMLAFNNNLTGELPESLGNCNSLRAVRVEKNRLTGKIPDGLWTAKNLSTFLLNDNLLIGQLPERVASNLSQVDIRNNQFSGELPAEMGTWYNLRVFRACNNLFTGKIPEELTVLPKLTELLLDGNKLSGSFPSNIVSWNSLTTLKTSRNQISGQIPAALGLLPNLIDLDLSSNLLSGEIPPEIGNLRLASLNLSSNRLTGRIPVELENAAFDRSFLSNPGLCASDPSVGLGFCKGKTGKSDKLPVKLLAALASVGGVATLVAALYSLFVLRSYRKRKQESVLTWKLTSFHKLDFTEADIVPYLTEKNTIGSGGSGQVYLVPLNRSRNCVAVKKIWNNQKLDHKLEKEFLAEVQILGTVRHSNIVKLLCCISSEESKLLVYEYMESRSLDIWLQQNKRLSNVSDLVLEWPKRLQIAIGAARGLCYMHHDCSPPIIHRDVKSSNVLLDSCFNAKIADFGLAKILAKPGDNTVTAVAGSFGYIAPEYARTTKVNEKIDVYSFGVILLELVTGKEANYGDEDSCLADWAWRRIQQGYPIVNVLDEAIKEPQYLDEMSNVFKLGIFCTSTFPSSRPTMKQVLQILFQCNNTLVYGEKKNETERDASPLLKNSRRERIEDNDDVGFISLI
ncbi:receptor-like protein kinase 5 [Nicotiana sylvestris]|uniref:Receptor-like protein kinase 5 n=1 Tax=Nicotiana sylvestris TaxID=4096 RepID=A0A1U7VDS1_NICSY|nr:PREDICTED: receptor-like protein kinase 5 [Nicotiana sylvestris]